MASQRSEKELRKLFKAIDTDKSGYITKDELIEALIKMKHTKEEAERAARSIMIQDDPNRDGKITLQEFLKGIQL